MGLSSEQQGIILWATGDHPLGSMEPSSEQQGTILWAAGGHPLSSMGPSSDQQGTVSEQHGTVLWAAGDHPLSSRRSSSDQQGTILWAAGDHPLGSMGPSSGQHGTILWAAWDHQWAAEDYPSSEHHGRFTASYAAIHSRRHLEHTSAPHSSSSGCERVLEHSAHFSSFSIDRLLALAKGGLGSLWRTRGGAIFSRWPLMMSYVYLFCHSNSITTHLWCTHFVMAQMVLYIPSLHCMKNISGLHHPQMCQCQKLFSAQLRMLCTQSWFFSLPCTSLASAHTLCNVWKL